MDVKVNETKAELPFPKLMSSRRGTIVLFYQEHCGTCLRSLGSDTPIGSHSRDWDMEYFEDFYGEVTLSN
jgi:hypothetical protein